MCRGRSTNTKYDRNILLGMLLLYHHVKQKANCGGGCGDQPNPEDHYYYGIQESCILVL